MSKYIFITGGISGLSKGLVAAAVGCLLEARGLRVAFLHLDPSINLDSGTISPSEQGEVFVTDDGTETDLTLGHFERFTSARLARASSWTAGRIYQSVMGRERRGDYGGRAARVIPDVTNQIKDAARVAGSIRSPDVLVVEVGGTVGDLEVLPFLEAARQMRLEEGRENTLFLHVAHLSPAGLAGEPETEHARLSLEKLRDSGIEPDALVCNSDQALENALPEKIALQMSASAADAALVLMVSGSAPASAYNLPLLFHRQGLDRLLVGKLALEGAAETDLDAWHELAFRLEELEERGPEVTVGVVGSGAGHEDAHRSLREALTHGGLSAGARVRVRWIEAEALVDERVVMEELAGVDAVLIPACVAGAGAAEGMIRAISFAREFHLPCLGICLGMRLMAVEYAREACGLEGAHSIEFDAGTPAPVALTLHDLPGVPGAEASVRLGSYPCRLAPDSLAARAYGRFEIAERHRHLCEINPEFRGRLERAGLLAAGTSPDGRLVEALELPRARHPWFLGCHFRPELKSKPLAPHPLFASLIGAARDQKTLRESAPRPAPATLFDMDEGAPGEVFTAPLAFSR